MKLTVYFLLLLGFVLLLCIVFEPVLELIITIMQTVIEIMQTYSS